MAEHRGKGSKEVPQNSISRSGREEWDYLNEPDKMGKRKNMRFCGS
jgi:hypothetical protein